MQNTTEILQAAGMGIAAIIAGIGAWFGTRKSDGKPPADRAPAPHEVKEALAELRRLVENMREDHNDDARQIANQLDRIENRLRLNDEIRHFTDRTIPPR